MLPFHTNAVGENNNATGFTSYFNFCHFRFFLKTVDRSRLKEMSAWETEILRPCSISGISEFVCANQGV